MTDSVDKKSMTWQEKLTRIQDLAMARDQIAHEFLGGTWKGGRLVLGRYYAQSDKIYLGLNPGYWPGVTNYPFCVDPAEAPLNSPFRNDPDDRDECRYFLNCEDFLDAHPCLRVWFEDQITSAFISPWRTKDRDGLYRLNRDTVGALFKHSGDILAQMIEDHNAEMLVVAGVSGLPLLEDVLHLPNTRPVALKPLDGAPHDSGCFQYGEWHLYLNNRPIEVLQIPHFSRAKSLRRLEPCATWLKQRLGLA